MLNSELGSAGGATSSNGEATQGSMERLVADAMASEGNEMVVSGLLVLADLDNGALELTIEVMCTPTSRPNPCSA